jgi:ribosome-associated toxin RatA of RatAB toxin-antitoxin module
MADQAAHSVVIEATPQQCYKEICAFETYPEWQKVITKVNIWSRYPDGRPKAVEYVLSALIKKIRYVIDYTYNDEEPSLHWTYVEGDLTDVSGHYHFEDLEDGTTKATYQLTLIFGMFIPQKVLDTLNNQMMKGSVLALKKRVEEIYK